jgi:hypothetical protein
MMLPTYLLLLFHFLVLEFLFCPTIAGFIAMYATLASRDVVS